MNAQETLAPTMTDLLRIMTNRINLDGKCDDAAVCKDIAAYLNTIPFTCYWHDTVWEFVYEYGEDTDDEYLGRDSQGEKQYHTWNPKTNWNERIRRELVDLGYYKRFTAWSKEQET